MHWSWFPPEDHINTGRLCSAGSELPTSPPASKLVCSPPTPSPPSAATSVPLVRGLPLGQTLVLPIVSTTDACACKRASFGDGSPALRHSGFSRGKERASRVTGLSSSYAPWCNIPPDTAPPRPYFSSRRSTERPPSPSENSDPSASGMNIVFGTTYPQLARSRTYASPVSLPRPSPGSLPARAGSPLAGRVSHPLDGESKFHEVIAPPFPFDQQCLVASLSLIPPMPHAVFSPRRNGRAALLSFESIHRCRSRIRHWPGDCESLPL